MTAFKEVWASSFQSAAISAAASEDFGGARADQEKRDKDGSANRLILSSIAEEDFEVRLDGLDSRLIGLLYRRGSLVIEPEDGIFFNTVRLTNISAQASSSTEVNVRIARANRLIGT